jgi:hypothetical protein
MGAECCGYGRISTTFVDKRPPSKEGIRTSSGAAQTVGNTIYFTRALNFSQMHNQPLQIVGRTGSIFTRLPLIFAQELGVAYELVVIKDLAVTEPAVYSENPALRMLILRDADLTPFQPRPGLRVCG